MTLPVSTSSRNLLGSLPGERGGGQGRLKGEIIRIGTMGDLTQTDVLGALGALEIALLEHGLKLSVGAGVRAALKVFLAAEEPAAV